MKEPSDVAILAARIQRAYPSLSPYSSASFAERFCKLERAQRVHCTRQCNDEWYTQVDEHGDPGSTSPFAKAERRITGAIAILKIDMTMSIFTQWGMEIKLENDPRGQVLLVRFHGEAELAGV